MSSDEGTRLGRPIEGVLFDVENNAFWHPTWASARAAGAKPSKQRDGTWPRRRG